MRLFRVGGRLVFVFFFFIFILLFFFFFQAEDGIRDHCVTGVQTCVFDLAATDNSTFS